MQKSSTEVIEFDVGRDAGTPLPSDGHGSHHNSKTAKLSVVAQVAKHPKVVLCSMVANIGALMWGYDQGQCCTNRVLLLLSCTGTDQSCESGIHNMSTALPGFKLHFGYKFEGQLLVSATWNALWTAMTFFGILMGGPICGVVSDWKGRRAAFAAGCCISFVGVGIMYAAESHGMLLASKIVRHYPAWSGLRCVFCADDFVLVFRSTAPLWASSSHSRQPTRLRSLQTNSGLC